MKTYSVIRSKDKTENTEAYKSANKTYYMVYVIDANGKLVPCMLTETNINNGIDRAYKNPEDVNPLGNLCKLYFKILAWLKK